MRSRKALRPLCCCSVRYVGKWDDGSDGYEWKTRDLNGKRSLAMSYIGDVKKRVPIHDAIRLKAAMNMSALRDDGDPVTSLFKHDEYHPAIAEDATEIIEKAIDDLLSDEFSGDTSKFIGKEDCSLLNDELFGDDSQYRSSLQSWMKVRRDTDICKSYASFPESERNDWTAWYLRHVKSSSDS